MSAGMTRVEFVPGVWFHRITCASCGQYAESSLESMCAGWLFGHSAPEHEAGQPAGVRS